MPAQNDASAASRFLFRGAAGEWAVSAQSWIRHGPDTTPRRSNARRSVARRRVPHRRWPRLRRSLRSSGVLRPTRQACTEARIAWPSSAIPARSLAGSARPGRPDDDGPGANRKRLRAAKATAGLNGVRQPREIEGGPGFGPFRQATPIGEPSMAQGRAIVLRRRSRVSVRRYFATRRNDQGTRTSRRARSNIESFLDSSLTPSSSATANACRTNDRLSANSPASNRTYACCAMASNSACPRR